MTDPAGIEAMEADLLQRRRRKRALLQEQVDAAFFAAGGTAPSRPSGGGRSSSRPAASSSGAAGGFSGWSVPSTSIEDEDRERRGASGGGGGAGGGGRGEGWRPTPAPTKRDPVAVKQNVAGGSQAAVIKLASFASGRASMGALVNYQSRNGALALEREDGSPLEGKEALAELVAQWAEEVDGPEPSKDSLAFTISVPGALAAGDVAGGLGQMLGGHRYAWRLEERAGGVTIHVVTSAASSRRDPQDRPMRIYDNQKSLAGVAARAGVAFGASAELGPVRFAHGTEGFARQMREASGQGALPLRTSNGREIDSPEVAREISQGWKRDLRSREPRDTAHIIISAKPGTPRDAFVDAARATLAAEFSGHHYAFALHTDRDHLHVHAIVRMDRADGQRLHPNIQDFRRWRETMAQEARQRHIPMEAMSRFDQAHTPSYKLGDVRAHERGRATDAQRRRIEGRQNRAVHVPTRDEGRRHAALVQAQWRAAGRAGAVPAGEPPVPAGAIRLYRAERPDRAPSSAPLYARDRAAVEALAASSGGRLVYLDVPRERLGEIQPARRNPDQLVMVSRSLAAASQVLTPIAAPPGAVLAFTNRADQAVTGRRPARDTETPGSRLASLIREFEGEGTMRDSQTMQAAYERIETTVSEIRALLPEKDRQEFDTASKELLDRGRDTINEQVRVERARPTTSGTGFDRPRVRDLGDAHAGYVAEITAKREVQYTRVDPQTHKRVAAFVDSGDKVTIQDWRNEASIAAAMALSAQKWDAITVAGSNEYKALAVRIAAREGYALTNPELQEQLQAERARLAAERERQPGFTEGRKPAEPEQDRAPGAPAPATPPPPEREAALAAVRASAPFVALSNRLAELDRQDAENQRSDSHDSNRLVRAEAARVRNEQAAMLADPEATLQRQRQEAEQSRAAPAGQGTTPTPGNTAAERQIALQQIAAETRAEARRESRESREANEAERRGIDNAAEGTAGHPYRSEQEARTAQQAARSVSADPNRPMQTEAGQSQKVQQLSAEQQRVLDNERRAQVEKQFREEEAAERARNKDQDRDR